jgi:multidrug efflux pump subunit AcrA (membrane-fusion protein)
MQTRCRPNFTRTSPPPPRLAGALLLSGAGGLAQQGPGGGAPPPPKVTVVTVQPQAVPVTTELPGRTSPYMVAEVRPAGDRHHQGAAVQGGQRRARRARCSTRSTRPPTRRPTIRPGQPGAGRGEPGGGATEGGSPRELAKSGRSASRTTTRPGRPEAGPGGRGGAKAALDKARVDLNFTRVASPIAGRIGRSTVTPGALVTANQADRPGHRAAIRPHLCGPHPVQHRIAAAAPGAASRPAGARRGQYHPGATAAGGRQRIRRRGQTGLLRGDGGPIHRQFFIDRPIFAWVHRHRHHAGRRLRHPDAAGGAVPDIAPPRIAINASYPGASAKTVEDSVTQIIEQKMTGIDGLLYMESSRALATAAPPSPDLRRRHRPRHRPGAGAEQAAAGHAAAAAGGAAAGRAGGQVGAQLPDGGRLRLRRRQP